MEISMCASHIWFWSCTNGSICTSANWGNVTSYDKVSLCFSNFKYEKEKKNILKLISKWFYENNALYRGVMDESGEQFVAYFLPLEETLEKRRRDFTAGIDYADDEEYEYKMAREYNWNVKSKASKGYEENYFLVIRQDGVFIYITYALSISRLVTLIFLCIIGLL